MQKSRPNISKTAFWDVNFEEIDFEKNTRDVINRILMNGKLADWKEINSYYGEAPFDKAGRTAYEAKKGKVLKFEAPNSFQDAAAFEVLPEKLYERILYENSHMT